MEKGKRVARCRFIEWNETSTVFVGLVRLWVYLKQQNDDTGRHKWESFSGQPGKLYKKMSHIPELKLKTPLDSRRFGSSTSGLTGNGETKRRTESPSTRTTTGHYGQSSTRPTADRMFGRPSTTARQVHFNSTLRPADPLSMSQRERERRKSEALNFLKRETSTFSKADQRNTETSGLFGSSEIGRSTGSRMRAFPANVRDYQSSSKAREKDPASIKTFELLGENPISRIGMLPSKAALYDENILKNITRESFRRNPLSTSPSRPNLSGSRISKPSTATPTSYTMKNTGLLNSLSNFGSKVFKSILYNEDEPTSSPRVGSSYNSPKLRTIPQDQRIESDLRRQRELDLQLEERRRYLEQLNEKIAQAENVNQRVSSMSQTPINDSVSFLDQSQTIDKQIEKLDNRLQSILNEVNIGSNGKLIEELGGIKDELASLRKKQETNNIKFESKFEDIKLENQKNRQKFDRLYQDLENKKKELDMEKNALLKLLKTKRTDRGLKVGILKSPSVRFRSSKASLGNEYDNVSSDSYSDVDEVDTDFQEHEGYKNDEDDDLDDNALGIGNDDDTGDIIRYLLKNKRRKDLKSSRVRSSRVRKIKNNLNKIELATDKNGSRVSK